MKKYNQVIRELPRGKKRCRAYSVKNIVRFCKDIETIKKEKRGFKLARKIKTSNPYVLQYILNELHDLTLLERANVKLDYDQGWIFYEVTILRGFSKTSTYGYTSRPRT